MTRRLLWLTAFCAALAWAGGVRAEAPRGKKISLFNGKDLTGWRVRRKSWIVIGGELRGAGSYDEAYLSRMGAIPSDFELGLTVKTTDSFQVAWFSLAKPEVTNYLARSGGDGLLRLQHLDAEGAFRSLARARPRRSLDAHRYVITVRGGTIRVTVDGRDLLRTDRGTASEGNRGLYLLVGENKQVAVFRDLWFRDLTGRFDVRAAGGGEAERSSPDGQEGAKFSVGLGPAAPLFDGEDPSDWSVRNPGWEVVDGAMVGTAGTRDAFLVRYNALPQNFKVSFAVNCKGSFQVLWPRSASKNHYRRQETEVLRREQDGTLRLIRYFGVGKPVKEIARSESAVPDGAHEFAITVWKSSIRVSVDGSVVIKSDAGKTVWGLRDLCLTVGGDGGSASFRKLQYQKFILRKGK